MKVEATSLPGVLLVELDAFADARGWFSELWRRERHAALGVARDFVQDNVSVSVRGTLRGLHHQRQRPQGKLITVLHGAIFDVAVDVRVGSPTFGAWFGAVLSTANHRQMWVPEGFAHGFLALEDQAVVSYKCTEVFVPGDDHAVRWDDPRVGIAWPLVPGGPILSARDAAAPLLDAAAAGGLLPEWRA